MLKCAKQFLEHPNPIPSKLATSVIISQINLKVEIVILPLMGEKSYMLHALVITQWILWFLVILLMWSFLRENILSQILLLRGKWCKEVPKSLPLYILCSCITLMVYIEIVFLGPALRRRQLLKFCCIPFLTHSYTIATA